MLALSYFVYSTRNDDPDMEIVIGDTESKYTDFQFSSFTWVDTSNGNGVYLFCTVVICDSSLPGDCFLQVNIHVRVLNISSNVVAIQMVKKAWGFGKKVF